MCDYCDKKILCETLKALSDEKYRSFNSCICKGSRFEMLGVRIPELRKIAKSIIRSDADAFLSSVKPEYYEEVMIKGLVLAGQRKASSEKLVGIESFLSEIDNWAVCDTFCAELKPKANELGEVLDFIKKHIYSANEFEIRVAVVLLLDYFISEEYIDETLKLLSRVDCGFYYTSMAVAWAYSVCYVRFTDKTYKQLKKNTPDKATLDRTVQKIVDSYRVSETDKDSARELKKLVKE